MASSARVCVVRLEVAEVVFVQIRVVQLRIVQVLPFSSACNDEVLPLDLVLGSSF
jgi:hypothetical protein